MKAENYEKLLKLLEHAGVDENFLIDYDEDIQTIVDKMSTVRTEEEILKSFEGLGYKVKKNNKYLSFTDCMGATILVDMETKSFFKDDGYGAAIDVFLDEFALLKELFTLWNW